MMEDDFRVVYDVPEADVMEIHSQLRTFNLAHTEASSDIPIGIFLEGDSGEKLAGLIGEIFGNWLCIQYLWVSESLRGQGIGAGLLLKAEEAGKEKGAKHAFVGTFSFQAPEFYTKCGYKEVFRLQDYPLSGFRAYYTKDLI